MEDECDSREDGRIRYPIVSEVVATDGIKDEGASGRLLGNLNEAQKRLRCERASVTLSTELVCWCLRRRR